MNLDDLKKPFQPQEHNFNYQKWAYIEEDVICSRLDEVVGIGNWKVTQPYPPQQVTATHYIATVELAIKIDGEWVVRVGTGEGTTSINNAKGDNDPLQDPRYVLNMGENAAKAAATDALRRAARLWGIGRYLLKLPKTDYGKPTVTNHQQLRAWLIENFKKDDPPPPAPTEPSSPKKDPTPPPRETVPDASGNGKRYAKNTGGGKLSNLQALQDAEASDEPMTDAEKFRAWLGKRPCVDLHKIEKWELPRGRKELRWTAWATADGRDDLRITLFSEDIAKIGEFCGFSVKEGHDFGGYPLAVAVRPDNKYHVRVDHIDPSLKNKAGVRRLLDEGAKYGLHIEDLTAFLGVDRFSDYVGTLDGVLAQLEAKHAEIDAEADAVVDSPPSAEKPHNVRDLPTPYGQKSLLDIGQHQRIDLG